jgi:hypothetical protein
MNYELKYIKYKNKYIELKNQIGGVINHHRKFIEPFEDAGVLDENTIEKYIKQLNTNNFLFKSNDDQILNIINHMGALYTAGFKDVYNNAIILGKGSYIASGLKQYMNITFNDAIKLAKTIYKEKYSNNIINDDYIKELLKKEGINDDTTSTYCFNLLKQKPELLNIVGIIELLRMIKNMGYLYKGQADNSTYDDLLFKNMNGYYYLLLKKNKLSETDAIQGAIDFNNYDLRYIKLLIKWISKHNDYTYAKNQAFDPDLNELEEDNDRFYFDENTLLMKIK